MLHTYIYEVLFAVDGKPQKSIITIASDWKAGEQYQQERDDAVAQFLKAGAKILGTEIISFMRIDCAPIELAMAGVSELALQVAPTVAKPASLKPKAKVK